MDNQKTLKFSKIKKILNHCFAYNVGFISIIFFPLFFCDFLINEKNDFLLLKLKDHQDLIKISMILSFIYSLILLIITIFILFKHRKILLKGNKVGTYENGLSIFFLWIFITSKNLFDIHQLHKYESFFKLCKSFQFDLTLVDFNFFITYLFFLFCSYALYKQLLENLKELK